MRVGVVTSKASAAWADFVHEIERSGMGFHLRLIDVRVQGDSAVREVTRALRTLSRHADLDAVVLIRGGGSRSELAIFDAESIAMAIAASPLPVFTGLGHEIDRSVADEVAHTALKTPTACAAALVEHVGRFRQRVDDAANQVQQAAEVALQRAMADVGMVAEGIRQRVRSAVERSDERLASRVQRVRAGTGRALERADQRATRAGAVLRRMPPRLDAEARQLDSVAERVRLLDPATTMARGWSITRTTDGRTVRSSADVPAGTEIITTFATGTARSRVEETTP
jgi:exodeoxyribonuclease VII large subunit